MRSGCQSLKTSSPLTQRQDGANKIRKAFVEGMRLNYLGFCDFKVVVVWGFTTIQIVILRVILLLLRYLYLEAEVNVLH